MIEKKIKIIIVAHNSLHALKDCLKSFVNSKIEVIVVDNISTDGTEKFIKNIKNVNIKYIKSKKNVGYGRGNNIGLKKVKTDYAVILNPDCFVEIKALKAILKRFKEEKNAMMISPFVYSKEEVSSKLKMEEVKQKYIDEIDNKNSKYTHIKGDLLYSQLVYGAIFMIDMKKFKEIGFFDENFFLYYEDDDLCTRIYKNNYDIIIDTSVHAIHLCGKSVIMNNEYYYRKFWHFSWSKMYFKQKYKGFFKAKKSAIRISISDFLKSLYYYFKDEKKFLEYTGGLFGTLSFLFGFKAFDSKDNPRGSIPFFIKKILRDEE